MRKAIDIVAVFWTAAIVGCGSSPSPGMGGAGNGGHGAVGGAGNGGQGVVAGAGNGGQGVVGGSGGVGGPIGCSASTHPSGLCCGHQGQNDPLQYACNQNTGEWSCDYGTTPTPSGICNFFNGGNGGNAGGTGGTGGCGNGCGGMGGRAGSDGGVPPTTVPCCVANLEAQCPRQGACQQSSDDGGGNSRSCYASGVKVIGSTEQNSCNTNPPSGVGTRLLTGVYGSDGSLCYSVEHVCYCGQACETFWTFWRNAAGDVVAQASSGSSTSIIQCTSGADAATSTDAATCVEPTASACSPGTCL